MNKPGEQYYRDSYADYKREMYISDAIYLHINVKLKNKYVLKKLLSHWWAPPLAMLTFSFDIQNQREHEVDMISSPFLSPVIFERINVELEENVDGAEAEDSDENTYRRLYYDMSDSMSDESSEDDNRVSYQTLFQNAINVFDIYFDFLAGYGGIPHGTNMYKELDDIMWYWNDSAGDVFAPYMTRYKQLTSEY
jgi:hypothetical protein